MNKEFRNTVKFLKKNKDKVIKTIIPVVIFCLLVTIIGILSPKPNDNITPSNTYLFENRNPDFNVGFGNKEYPDKSFVRFEAKVDNSNPFEQEESNLWDRVKGIFTTKKQGFEFGLTEVRFDDTESESSSNIFTNISDAVKNMEVDDVSTDTEVIEVGRLLGEKDENTVSKKTVINKDVYPGVDLEYQILENLGVKEEIVIRDIDAYTSDCGDDRECLVPLNKFVFNLRLDEGLQLKKSLVHIRGKTDTKYYITDSDDNYIAHFLPTFAVDGVGSKTTDVDLDIYQIEDENYKVEVILNLDWLFSSDRVFPIRIDPSIVHDTTTEFDTGYDYNTEVVTGPKVQLQEAEGDAVDTTVEGLWHLDKEIAGAGTITVTGGTKTTDGSYTVHTFTSSSSLVVSGGSIDVEYLVVAGGGGGGGYYAGGGGAGGLLTNMGGEKLQLTGTTHTITVGSGGIGNSSAGRGNNGGNSSIGSYVNAVGGGGGGGGSSSPGSSGGDGGSGGGASYDTGAVGGSGTSGQGYDGGDGYDTYPDYAGGGGGGAGSAGSDSSGYSGGSGGSGVSSSITGSSVTYATGGDGGSWGGGDGADASNNTGDGGGGANSIADGGNGGSGIVVIRYLTSSLTLTGIEDYSSNSNDGTISGATHTLEGKYHGAMYFDGTNDYIEVDNDSSLQLTNDFTIALWVYRTGEGGGTWPRILSKSSASGSFDYSVQVTETYGSIPEDHIMFAITKSDTNTHYVVSSRELEFNRWTHIVCTIDSSNNLKLYMDGEDVSGLTDGTVGAARSTTSNLQFGRLGDSGGWHYNYVGHIDEILIMSDAISADDAARLYTNGYESVVLGAHTSASLDLSQSSDVEAITWTPVGDDTGDGETVYSTTNLIGQWNFNETSGTTADNVGSCGATCDGTLYSMTTTGQDAAVGTGWTSDNRRWGAGALMFDGTNDYAYVTSNSDLRPTNNFTVEAWVNTNEISGTQTIIKHSENGGGDDAWGFGITDEGKLTFSAANTGDDQFIVSNETLRPGEWYYVVGIYDNSTLKLYVNGKLDKTQTASGNVVYEVTDYVIIGKRGGTSAPNTCYFNGTIDSIRFYTRVLSATEILSNYQSGNIEMRYRTSTDNSTWTDWSGDEEDVENFNDAFLYDADDEVSASGLVSYWAMDDLSGSTVTDSFGSNNGTATGTTVVDSQYYKGRDFGGSDYITVPDSTSLNLGDTFSISVWIKPDTTDRMTVYSHGSNASGGFQLEINRSGYIGAFGTIINGVYVSYTDAGLLKIGDWNHIAYTRSGSGAGTHTLYLNGVPQGLVVDASNSYTDQTADSLIGARLTSSQRWNGVIDELRLYDDPLSSSAIRKEYQEGLISYWKMDETSGSTAVDFVGTNDGTASGTTIVDAKYGKGRTFNGSSDYVSVADNSSLQIANDLTVSTWMKTTTTPGSYTLLVRKDTESGTRYLYGIGINSSDEVFGQYYNGSNFTANYTGSDATDGNWHHAVMTIKGRTLSFYFDGVLANTTTITGTQGVPTGELDIGAAPPYTGGGRNSYFTGTLDDVKVFDRALTESEIQNEYLVGYWSMEELSGSTVYDVTGDDHGTATGTTIEEGKHGNARWFDGDDLIASSSTTTMEATDEFTISAWVYATSIPSVSTEGRTVASKWDWVSATETYGWNFGAIYSGPFFQFSVSDGGHATNQIIEDQEFFTHHLNEWVHMVGVFKASNYLKLYRNGELIDEMTSGVNSTIPYTTDDPFTIGRRSKDTQSYWDGGIDEVKYYEKALSEESIKQLFSEGSTKPESLRTRSVDETIEGSRALQIETDGPIIDGNTVGYWTLDETGGASAYIKDSSGNGNNGTPSGTTYIKEGKIGGARDFNGSSDYVNISWSSTRPTDNFTVEGWFTTDTTHEIDTESDSGTTGTSGQKYLFYPNWDSDAGMGVSVGTNGISVYEHSSSYLAPIAVYEGKVPGGWNHVAIVYIEKTPHIYLNGVHVHTGLTSTKSSVTVFYDLGGDSGSDDYGYHDGMIDEVRISDISRSAEEILESYNLGKYKYTTKTISSADISDDSYLPFWVASEDLGHNLDLIYGNSPYANYQPDENTVGLWHMDENIPEEEEFLLSGGTESTDGDYTLYTFTSSGTLSVTGSGTIDVVAVGGGGGASYSVGTSSYSGAGGGGGGLGYRDDISVSSEDLTVTVGTGGDGGTSSSNDGGDGGDTYLQRSSTDLVKANGGDGGVSDGTTASGGSGGTTALAANDGGGNGGSGGAAASNDGGGGGGGAGGYSGNGGNGGVGNSGTGSNGSGGGGGGGGGQQSGGTQNNGGGGVGVPDSGTSGTGGAVNNPGTGGSGGNTGTSGGHGGGYGGGGGGAEDDTAGDGGDGGDGVLIVKVLTSALGESSSPSGGTISIDGDYTLHTFYTNGRYDFENTTFPPDSEWSTSGDANWTRSTSTYYEGSASAASGDIGDSETTVLEWETTLAASGTLSFYWSVSSESTYDFLVFCIDNASCSSTSYDERISGTVSWTQVQKSVTSGSHTFTWLYEKDANTSSGSDMGWVDFIQYPVGSTQSFTVPDGYMGSVDAVAIGGGGGGEQYTSGGSGGGGGGLGWMNGIPLSGGDYSVAVGSGGAADSDIGSTCNATDGVESYFMDRTVVRGDGGGAAEYDTGGIGGAYKGEGGGNGGDGATSTIYAGGGGGAGGYSGDGGDGGDGDTSSAGSSGSGGAGGGGGGGGSYDYGGGGGGVDPYGSGTSGAGGSWTGGDGGGGGGGSGGENGNTSGYADGGLYGGGGGGADNSYGEVGNGGDGVVVIKYLTDGGFKAEGTIKDSSGNGYNGINEGSTYMEEAKLGGGRFFDGDDDLVTLSDNDYLDFTTGDFTVEAWVKSDMEQVTDQWPGIVSKEGGSTRYGYNLLLMGSTVYDGPIFQIYSGGSGASAIADTNVRDGLWHHVVGVKTSSSVKIYVDGVLQSTGGHSLGTVSQTSFPFTIGKLAWSGDHRTEGTIDEVRVSDVARTADEIRQAYEVGRRTHPITIDFRADLESGNLITGSTDLSFTISEQDYGTTDHIENIDVVETIVVKENYGGTEYFAQGEVATVNTSTGAVTVSSWDNGSTFPTSGFTANAIVYKWQREYVDIRYPLEEDINGISTLTFRKTSSVGTKFWIDDTKRATYSSDYAGTSFETIEGVQYVQYRPVFSTWDDNRELDLYISQVDVDYTSGPTMDQVMRHGKWFNSSGEEQPFWWVNNE